MTIREARFDIPWKLGQTRLTDENILETLAKRDYTRTTYPEGSYDVSPSPQSAHRHELVVFDNGTGLYRVIPRDNTPGFTVTDHDGAQKTGGNTYQLGEGNLPFMVVGYMAINSIEVYGIILYNPGPSPKQIYRAHVQNTQQEQPKGQNKTRRWSFLRKS
jgi:hypothetical protein